MSLSLEGTLFRFATSPSLHAFESPASHAHTRYAIFVGGLTDGLLACDYVPRLAAACDLKGWALVQPLLSSACKGYGTSSIAADAEELAALVSHLRRTRQLRALALLGHSSGCQAAVAFLAAAPPPARQLVVACGLQAAVSDREAWAMEAEAEKRERTLREAARLVAEGRGGQLLQELHYGFVPITAERYTSLFARGGDEDFFSSDLTDDELSARLGHMSGADEYVPPHVDAAALAQRFAKATGAPEATATLVIEGANHALTSPEGAADAFIDAVGELLDKAIGRKFSVDEDF
ncbi:hypothetical protein AB1Y20_017212 [Prymnesium parvum]|uniref:AB hydrolase-1 domain-containing protein n=1 Tax=Prymnesium parvum TaxID=97485 RepID=A0AB34ICH7_PRYPA